jgi:Domain of unknown function (DUF4253)
MGKCHWATPGCPREKGVSGVLQRTTPGRIGLVGAERAADIPFLIGWWGATNHFTSGEGPELLSVMMRSWEDRLGARLLRIGFDTMIFSVLRPPRTEAAALAVAAEHFASPTTTASRATTAA